MPSSFLLYVADKAADCTNKEQLPLVPEILKMMGMGKFYLYDSGTSGHSIAAKILEALEVYGPDATYVSSLPRL